MRILCFIASLRHQIMTNFEPKSVPDSNKLCPNSAPGALLEGSGGQEAPRALQDETLSRLLDLFGEISRCPNKIQTR